jgi:hypothetical protein
MAASTVIVSQPGMSRREALSRGWLTSLQPVQLALLGTDTDKVIALHRAGWSLGEACLGSTWQVDGSNGENRLLATGTSQAEAWYRATLQAREMGLLAPIREDDL